MLQALSICCDTLSVPVNRTKSSKLQKSICGRDRFPTQSLMQSQSRSQRICLCVLRVVWALQLEELRHVLLQQFDVSSGNQSIQSQLHTRTHTHIHIISSAVLGPHFRHIYNVADRLGFVAWQHVAATFTLAALRFSQATSSGKRGQYATGNRHHHYYQHHSRHCLSLTLDAVCLLWPIGGAFVPTLAFFSISLAPFHSFVHALSFRLSVIRFRFRIRQSKQIK